MTLQRTPHLAIAILITAVLAGCAAPETSPSESTSAATTSQSGAATTSTAAATTSVMAAGTAPQLQVGDKWTERTATGGPYPSDTTTSREVKALESVMLGSTSHNGVRIDTGTTSKIWLRASDHARLKVHTEVAGVTSDTVYDAPCKQYEWPLAVGKAWTASCSAKVTTQTTYGTTTSNQFTNTSYTVASTESVTVTAGTFPTFKVTFTEMQGSATTTGTNWYAMKACTPAKTMQTSQGVEATLTLESYTCAAGA